MTQEKPRMPQDRFRHDVKLHLPERAVPSFVTYNALCSMLGKSRFTRRARVASRSRIEQNGAGVTRKSFGNPDVSIWQPTHQFSKSLRDFLGKVPGLLWGIHSVPRPPLVPFVISVGAARPLLLDCDNDALERAVNKILATLKQYVCSPPRGHTVSLTT
jgi:hypothetical protein